MPYIVARYVADAPYQRPLSKVGKTWIGNYGIQSDNPFSLRKKLREMRRTFAGQRFTFGIRRVEDRPRR